MSETSKPKQVMRLSELPEMDTEGVLATTIDLEGDNVPVHEALGALIRSPELAGQNRTFEARGMAGKRVTLSLHGVTVEQALKEIARQTGLNFYTVPPTIYGKNGLLSPKVLLCPADKVNPLEKKSAVLRFAAQAQ